MTKTQELTDPTSCLNKARADELLFVLLARDAAAPVAIRAWIAERVRLGKNQPGDAKIMGAEADAQRMEWERLQRNLGDIVPEQLEAQSS